MCGIVGYIGKHKADKAANVLLDGLGKLEYRGYDSAGIAVLENGKIRVEKSVGRLAALRDKIKGKLPKKCCCCDEEEVEKEFADYADV